MKRRLRTPLLLLLLFLAVWTPRVLALDAFVTPDEPLWLYRSANFYQAISQGDFAHTIQKEHPGVTVTWAGALGFLQRLPGYAQQGPGQLAREQLEPWLREHSTVAPLQLLTAARWWMVLWISLLTVAAYFPLRKLFGATIAALAVIVIGLGSILHRAFTAAPPGRPACHPDRLCAARLPGLAVRRRTGSLFRPFRSRRGPGLPHQDPRAGFDANGWTVAPA